MTALEPVTAFDCPVPWCAGLRGEHGADGEPPETWLHTSAEDRFEGLGFGELSREGAGPVGYFVHLAHDAPHDAAELVTLAAGLRRLAAHLEERAALLPAL